MIVTVYGLGSGKKDTLTIGLLEKIKTAPRTVLQTASVEAADYLKAQDFAFDTLDALYETAQDFDALNKAASDYLLDSAEDTLFACLGAPYENTAVLRLIKDAAKRKIKVSILPGVTDADEALCASLQSPEANSISRVTASQIEGFYPDTQSIICVTQIDTPYKAAAVKLKLADIFGDTQKIMVYAQGAAKAMKLYQLDRLKSYDYGTAVCIFPAPLIKKERYSFNDLLRIMDRLRGKNGCPWDKEQTHTSLKQYLLEESHEVLEAIDEDDMQKLYDELGDVMLQVVFHACIAKQAGEFDISDITSAICQKMITRHPHIFGRVKAATSKDVLINWEAIKKKEKGLETYTEVLRDIPNNLPALMRSCKVQKKAADIGFDWEDPQGAVDKIKEETIELMQEYEQHGGEDRIKQEAGDLLFSVVNLCRMLHVEPETALLQTTQKFINRFEYMEKTAKERGKPIKELSLQEMDKLWDEAKQNGL